MAIIGSFIMAVGRFIIAVAGRFIISSYSDLSYRHVHNTSAIAVLVILVMSVITLLGLMT